MPRASHRLVAVMTMLAGLLALAAAPAMTVQAQGDESFGPALVAMKCRTIDTIRAWSATQELTLDPVNPGVGSRVTVIHTVSGGGESGPVPIAAGELMPTSIIEVTGAHEAVIRVTGPLYGQIPPRTQVPGAVMTASFVVEEAGPLHLRVRDIVFDHPLVDTHCNNGADPFDDPAPTTITAAFEVSSQPGPSTTLTADDGAIITDAAQPEVVAERSPTLLIIAAVILGVAAIMAVAFWVRRRRPTAPRGA